MPSKDREYRNLAELLAPDEEKRVKGYATTFDQPYKLWGDASVEIWEVVDRNAFAKTDVSDVIMQFDHQGRVFARTRNKTLALRSDEHGLLIDADLGGTEIGRELYEEIKGGYTTKMSFGFIVDEDKREITENAADGTVDVLRTITKIRKLYDVSAVSLPANDGTEISARSYSDGVIAELKAERLAAEQRARKIAILKLLTEV